MGGHAIRAVFTYTSAGRRASVTDARGTTTYSYDSQGRLTLVAAPEGSIGYGYDAASRVTSMVTAAGTTSYARDALGRISQVTDPAGGVYGIGRDDAGRVTRMTFPNGVTEDYTYDAAGRPMTVTVMDTGGAELASFAATRDVVGRITALNDSVAGTTVDRAFGYDDAGRLTQVVSDASGAASTTDYALDGLGNRVTTTVDGSAETATVNDLDQLTALGGDAFTYDNAGRLVSATRTGGTTTYSWTSQGELASVTTPSATVDYGYDVAGNVVNRTEVGATVEYVYDSLTGLPRAVSASDGSWWVYVGGVPLAQHTATGSTTTGTTSYLHTDIRGDVRVATDASGAVTDTWTYSVDGQLTSRTGTTPVSVGYRGETSDPTTGLIWLRARWYDPTTARFLSADPWHGNPANPISLNRYLYANADPVNLHDPTGLETKTLSEQLSTLYVHAVLLSIEFGGVIRSLAVLAAVTASLLAVETGVLLVYFALDGPTTDEDIDRDGPIDEALPETEIFPRDSTDPALQPQTDGAGARNGRPVGCEAEPGVFEGTSAVKDGVIYMRTNLLTGATYIGQAKSWARYETRKQEHRRANPLAEYKFKVLSRTDAGSDLDRVEQYYIDACGGPTNKSNPDGELDNYRNQMNPDRYLEEGGDPWQ